MKIKTDLFCSLSSHPLWHQWLKEQSATLFDRFMGQFKESKSCANNAKIMMDLLPYIEESGLKDALIKFLARVFPNMVEHDVEDEELLAVEKFFLSHALTYPRRVIIYVSPEIINEELNKVLDGKIKYEYIISGNKIYLEYLIFDDIEVQDKIPDSKWLLKSIKEKIKNRR